MGPQLLTRIGGTLKLFLALGLVWPAAQAQAAGPATYISFQEGDLRQGTNEGVGTNGVLVGGGYTTVATGLRTDAPTTSQNGSQVLAGNIGSITNRILLGFDLSHLSNVVGTNFERIDSAALVLTHDTIGAGSGSVQTVYVSDPFEEGSATWNNPGSGAPAGGTYSTPLRDRSVVGTRTAPQREIWGSPSGFWGADTGLGPDMLVDAVRQAFTNHNRTLWLMVRRKTELENTYYSRYVHDEDARVDLRPELLVGVDSVENPELLLTNYTLVAFRDDFNGSALDTNLWAVGTLDPWRTNVSVADGMLRLTTRWQVDRWQEGLLETRTYAAKYGYYECRMRLNGESGLNNAFWLNTIHTLNSAGNVFDRAEIDITEAHHAHNDSHMTLHDWAPTHVSPFSSTLVVPNISDNFHVVGLDWRADNSLVFYWDGIARATVLQKFQGMDTMIPLAVLFSTKAISFAGTPGPNLDGSQMLVDYVTVRQKPGWLGAASSDWTNPANWGPDGVPGTGWAAVFNGPTPRPVVSLGTDISCHSLYFDNAACPGHTIVSGASVLRLGAASTGIGGITIAAGVTNTQTINANLVAERGVQFGNFSRAAVPAKLVLNGDIDAASSANTIQLCCFAPIEVNGAFSPNVGPILKWGGDRARLTGANSNPGPIYVAQGTLIVASATALGQAGSASPTVVSNNGALWIATGIDYTAPETLVLSGDGPGTGAVDLETAGTARFAGPIIVETNVALACSPPGGKLTLSGAISGSGEILKIGEGILELRGSNMYAGRVRVGAGLLEVRHSRALGDVAEPTLIENTGGLLVGSSVNSAEPLEFEGAPANHTHLQSVEGSNTLAGVISLLGGGYDYGITVVKDHLRILGDIAFVDSYSSLRTLQLMGAGTGMVSGVLSDGPNAQVGLRVAGPGTWRLESTNFYTGPTTITGGTFQLSGAVCSPVTLSNGTFTGTGIVSNKVTVYAGVHAPGAPVGIQKIQGDYSLADVASLRVTIRGAGPGAHSRLSVRGAVSLAGSLDITALPSLQTNNSFIIIDNEGMDAVIGGFMGLVEGATFFANGFTWKISYRGGDGNDVVLTILGRTSPALSMSQTGSWLALSWPDWADAYQLRVATNLLPPAAWFPWLNAVTLSNGAFYTDLPPDCPQAFFRLQFP